MKHAEKDRFARTGVCRNVCTGLRLGALAVSLALCGLLAGCGGNGADPAEKAIVDDVAASVEAYDSVLSALGWIRRPVRSRAAGRSRMGCAIRCRPT